jgi:HSP20 family protein
MSEATRTETRRVIAPAADICEESGQVVLRLEMPGVEKNDLSISIENDELIITAARRDEDVKGTFLIRERRRADYEKRYTLDDTIDRNKVDAVMKNGVLHLTLHIKESSKPRRIEIKAV